MKYTQIIVYITLLLLISCKEQSKKQTSVIQNKILKATDNNINSDSSSKKVVYDFYKWYINDVYLKRILDYDRAPYKKHDKNKYGLDIETYKKSLKRVSFFSESFKEVLIEENKLCSEAMINSDLGGFDPKYDADFYLENGKNTCNYLWKPKWFGSQEGENNKFVILDNFSKENNIYKYLVQTFMYEEPFTKYEVIVVKENGLFKINSINNK